MPNFLSQADCAALMQRVASFARGGGDTYVALESTWLGTVRWARNLVSATSDIRSNEIQIKRTIRGAGLGYDVRLNTTDDIALAEAVRRAEHFCLLYNAKLESDLVDDYQEPIRHPTIWFDATYHLDAGHRVEVVRSVLEPIAKTGMLSAGDLQVRAAGRSVQSTRTARASLYYPYTTASFSLTVRDPKGTGSGWAGVDWNDWTRIDPTHLAQVALDKCLRSRNPVAVEPGRYTTILEPQAVGDLMNWVFDRYNGVIGRPKADGGGGPFAGSQKGYTKIGEQILDERLTISADPMDPELGVVPFDAYGDVINPVVWVEKGVLQQLAYDRSSYGVPKLRVNRGLPPSGAFRMSGGTTTIEEMIATTKRGLLVTRFSNMDMINDKSCLVSGYTRDGLWLVENGKISKAVKNFRFTESPLFVFNQVEQLGVPQRIFHPEAPIVVPPAKVRDFSFTSLADAV
jgi:hypothetical protein